MATPLKSHQYYGSIELSKYDINGHTKSKVVRTQWYTNSYRQLRRAGRGNIGLPQGRTVANSQPWKYINNTVWTEQVIFRNMYGYTHMHTIIINWKRGDEVEGK